MKVIVKPIRADIEIAINKYFTIKTLYNEIRFIIGYNQYVIYESLMYRTLFNNRIMYNYRAVHSNNYEISKNKRLSSYKCKHYETLVNIKIKFKFNYIYLIFMGNKFNNFKILKKDYNYEYYSSIKFNLYDIKNLNANDFYKSNVYFI